MINLSSLRINNSSQFLDTSSVRLGLKFVLLDLSSDFSENFLFLSFRRILIRSFSRSRLDFRFRDKSELGSYTGLSVLVRAKRTELATNFLHESDKFVSGSLVLLAPD